MTQSNVTWENVVAYAAGELAPQEYRRVADALADNPRMQARANRLQAAIGTMRTDDSLEPRADGLERYLAAYREQAATQSAWRLSDLLEQVATLLFDTRTQPAVAGLRGTGQAQLAFEANGTTVEIGLEPSGETWHVTGQVSAEALPTAAIFEDPDQDIVSELSLDEHGMFTTELAAGVYHLRLVFKDRLVTIRTLAIG